MRECFFKKKKTISLVFECFELGRISYEQKDYYHTIRWMTESLELLNKSESKEVDRFKILDYLSFSTAQVISRKLINSYNKIY
jgi:hypothetical protein